MITTPGELSTIIINWLRTRNKGELNDAIEKMSLGDFERMHRELEHILTSGEYPKNWVK